MFLLFSINLLRWKWMNNMNYRKAFRSWRSRRLYKIIRTDLGQTLSKLIITAVSFGCINVWLRSEKRFYRFMGKQLLDLDSGWLRLIHECQERTLHVKKLGSHIKDETLTLTLHKIIVYDRYLSLGVFHFSPKSENSKNYIKFSDKIFFKKTSSALELVYIIF